MLNDQEASTKDHVAQRMHKFLRMRLNFFSRCELNLIKCLKELVSATVLALAGCTFARF